MDPTDKPARKPRRSCTQVMLERPRTESQSIHRAVAEYVARTVEELGGMDALSAGQRAMLLHQKTALSVALACEDELVESGALLAMDGKPVPLLKTLNDFLTIFRHGQVALGLARRRVANDRTPTLHDIFGEYRNRPTSSSVQH